MRRRLLVCTRGHISYWLIRVGNCASDWPVVGHRERDLKLGKELEVLLLSLIGETGTDQQHLFGTSQDRKSAMMSDRRGKPRTHEVPAHPEVLGSDHSIPGQRARRLEVHDPLQTLREPHGTQEVEGPQAVAGVGEMQQGPRLDQEADGWARTNQYKHGNPRTRKENWVSIYKFRSSLQSCSSKTAQGILPMCTLLYW